MSRPLNVQKFLAQVLALRRYSGLLHGAPLHMRARMFFLDATRWRCGTAVGTQTLVHLVLPSTKPWGAFPLPRQPLRGRHLWKGRACPPLSCSFLVPSSPAPAPLTAKEAGDIIGCRDSGEQKADNRGRESDLAAETPSTS